MGFKSSVATAMLLAVLLGTPAPSNASLYRTTGGSDAVQDIVAKINALLEGIRVTAEALIGDVDKRIEAHLDEVDGIVDDVVANLAAIPADAEARTLTVLRETEQALLDLEKKVFADVKKAIFELECGGERFTLGTLQAGLGRVGDVIGMGRIRIRPPLPVEVGPLCSITRFCNGDPTFDVADNFERTAIEIRAYMLEALSGLEDDQPAYAIPETYNYLALLARRTTCFVGVEENPWVEDHIRYTKAAQDWHRYVNPARLQ